jgi:Mn-dependent DtxR family transcriptional regulator
MPKLTDTQLVILNTAAGRETRAVLPLPKSLKVNKGTATSVLKAMIAKGLLKERPAKPADEIWRQDGDGRGFILLISDAGLAVFDHGAEVVSKKAVAKPAKADKRTHNRSKVAAGKAASAEKISTGKKRPGGKVDAILTLVRRPEGARIAELQKATGWQPHSVRAALTGLRKRGIDVTRSKEGDATVYRAKAA